MAWPPRSEISRYPAGIKRWFALMDWESIYAVALVNLVWECVALSAS